MKPPFKPLRSRYQRGISLMVVMVIVLLMSLLVLGASRITWLNERVVGSEADTQRAFAAAEALIRDAELDIQGLRFDGQACTSTGGQGTCRSATPGAGYFPQSDNELDPLVAMAAGSLRNCLAGLCLPPNSDAMNDAWRTDADLLAMSAVGATYGQFTGANGSAAGNPLLDSRTPRGWYWIEVLRYSSARLYATGTQGLPVPKPEKPYIYRIHAVVQGMRPGTRVHLRSLLIPEPLDPP